VDDILIAGNSLLQDVEVIVERFIVISPSKRSTLTFVHKPKNYTLCSIPDTQHDLELLVLGSRNDVHSSVAVIGGIDTDKSSQALKCIEVGFVVASGLAGAVGILVTQG
jgi:hypothetical protein